MSIMVTRGSFSPAYSTTDTGTETDNIISSDITGTFMQKYSRVPFHALAKDAFP